MVLSLQPAQARDVIEQSENCEAFGGGGIGHTKRQHVLISRERLLERMEEGPHRDDRKEVFWRAAFLDIHSCAELLSQTITRLNGNDFVRDFDTLPNGTRFPDAASIEIGQFECRDFRGRCVAWHVKLVMQKHTGRPHNLHLITFYPIMEIS